MTDAPPTAGPDSAILYELEALRAETRELRAAQAAGLDVLQAMSASPGDSQPVFDLIARQAAALCSVPAAAVTILDGDVVRLATQSGLDPAFAPVYASQFPRHVSPRFTDGRAIFNRRIEQIEDISTEPGYEMAHSSGPWSTMSVPLLRKGVPLGAITIGRPAIGRYSDKQVALLQTFAEQAVIAIASTETFRALQESTEALATRNSEYGERIAHQSATIDVLKALSASPGDTQPVFDLIVRHVLHACNGMSVGLFEYDGELVHTRASFGGDEAAINAFHAMFPRPPTRDYLVGRAILDGQTIHVRDIDNEPDVLPAVRAMGGRTTLSMPLLRDGGAIGAISLNTTQSGGFSDSQIELLRTFAEQAVIAISSAETFRALQERTATLARRNSEYGERIAHQSATINVLKAMSVAAGNEEPVLELIARHARELCDAETIGIFSFDGAMISVRCVSAVDMRSLQPYLATFPRGPTRDYTIGRAILDRQVIEVDDSTVDANLAPVVHAHGNRSIITLPFLIDDRVVGGMSIAVRKSGGLSDSQKALARILTEQAVIAITSAGNFRALQERTAALSRSVTELQALEEVLRAVNSSLELETVLATIISRAVQLSEADQGTIYEFDEADEVFVPKAAFGMTAESVAALRDRRIRMGQTPLGNSAVMRAPLHIPDLTQTLDMDGARELVRSGMHSLLAVPLLHDDKVVGGLVIRRGSVGGFAPSIPTLLQTFAGQCVLAIENARLFREARQARATAETAFVDLRSAQDRLVQAEKMASLGQLTAGIAHEIKNPLNFVNNFSDLSRDLLDELNDAVAANQPAEIEELSATLKGNLEKIAQHGRRADSIVRNMLQHSRSGPSEHRTVDLNAAVEEALNLAYHGTRAETPGFNITLKPMLDPAAGIVELYPQEFARVVVNLINNGFYATRRRTGELGFEPTLWVSTQDCGREVEIRVRDNGTGISPAVRQRIFEPFFTTKPTGEGTGLGLSLSYDIIVKQHGGRLTVDSAISDFTEFVITLPRTMAASDGGQA